MADHILCDIYRDEALSVMDGNSMANELWKNDRPTGPRPDDPLLRTTVHGRHFLKQLAIDKWPFTQ
jgi:hypothetical protein